MTQNTEVPIPPLVWKGWWLYCLPAFLGFGIFFFGDEYFDARGGSGSGLSEMLFMVISFNVGLFASVLICWRKYRRLRSWLERSDGCMCTACGYDLHLAQDAGDCPECGHPYRRAEAIAAWAAWKSTAYSSSNLKKIFSPYFSFFGFRFRRNEFFIVIAVFLIANNAGDWLHVGPDGTEVSRAEEAFAAAHNASEMARQEWYRVMDRTSGATDEQRKAATFTSNATAQAETEVIARAHEVSKACRRARRRIFAGYTAFYLGAAFAFLTRKYWLPGRVTH
ncbi:MAG: hypothetical protein K8R92_10060 [Planctomycetes bacterium]|nr:hypothetical protein [Planctomycetota bacterium]